MPWTRSLPRRLALAALALALLAPAAAEAKKKAPKPPAEEEKAEWNVSEPPGEWRAVTIDTTETTWSSVDVSPDGTTIVLDMLGDLYTVPIGGGEATELTAGIEWNQQPRFSPDGTKIAFISDRSGADNLWVMDADGSNPVQVSEERAHLVHNPYWSPDGEWLLAKKGFVSGRSIPAGEIWMFHRGGGMGLQLTERPFGKDDQKTMAEPAFSRDGRYVYFSQDTTPGRVWAYNKDSTGQIFVIQRLDRETGEIETLIDGPGGAILPTPSPDGATLAFVRRTPAMTSAIFLKDLATGKEWAIYDRLDRDLQETNGSQGNTPAISWTPDGGSIVFWAHGGLHRVDVASRAVSDIPVHVKATKKVHPALRFPVQVAPDTVRVRMIRWAQQTPGGEAVVFQALGHLWARDAAGGEPRRLTAQEDHGEFWPSVSPDGASVVYTTWDDDELGSVRVVGLDGSGERTIVSQPGIYVEPRFSPDGSKVVYRKITGGYLLSAIGSVDPGIYVVDAGGAGEPARVSESGFAPQFSPDGERVLFSAPGEDDHLQLKSVDLAGEDERTHLDAAEAVELSVSPDGRWVAFVENYDAWIAPFTLTGRTVDLGSSTTAVPVRRVSKRSGEFLRWSGDSSALHWALGATLYTRKLSDAFAFLDGAPEELPEPVETGVDLSFGVPADRPAGTIALVGGRVVTMRDADNTQEVIEDGVVLIEGNRIAAVGRFGEVEVPSGAELIDVSGDTVIPGLVDVHAHGGFANTEVLPEQNWMQLSNLAFGVTTIHDPSNDTSEVFSAAELQRTGALLAPRIFSTGTILYGAMGPGYATKIDSYEDALFHVRRLADVGAISVKSYNHGPRDSRQQVIAAAESLGIMVVPEGGAKFQHNMTEVVDGHTGIEHAIPIPTAYDDVRQLWSETEVGYTPTFVVAYGGLSGETYWYDRTDVWEDARLMAFTPRKFVEPQAMRRTTAPDIHYNHFLVAQSAKALLDRGVQVHIGAHGQREGLAAHWELWMMEQGGFTPFEALRAGTIHGAHYLGLDGDIGSIEPGKLADLAVIEGNPLDNLRLSENVAYTVLNGRVYESATMNQVAPDPVERGPLFFQKEGGDTIHPETWKAMEEKAERFGWKH